MDTNEVVISEELRKHLVRVDWNPCEYWWHVYHDLLAIKLPKGVSRRVLQILATKPEEELILRLRLLRPVESCEVQDWIYSNPYDLSHPPQFVLDAHKRECVEDCPWDGHTILGGLE